MYKSLYRTLSKRGYITLLALLISISTFAQNVTVNGVIYDETNLPLIGATVQVKGGQVGAATDLDGKFTIKASKNATLVVSYIGYKNQEIKLQGKTQISVKLQPDYQTLDEVVVVGYGTMKKSDLTGSVASVSAKNVEGFKTSSVMETLGGQIAGVQITQTDGTPGSGFSVNIRGVGTMTGDASPLYIVDGFEVPSIDQLSNSDIESIEILKDASASAIYGARAANGVVLVTTKSGKVGRPVVVYNGSASYRHISKNLDMLTPYEFVKLQVELKPEYERTYYREGTDSDGIPYRHQTIDDYIGEKGVDWQEHTFNPTWSQDHNINISGGTNDTKYSASLSHYNENGIFTNSGFKKTTGKFRINQKLTKAITLDATFNYADMLREGVGTTADNGRFNMLAMILRARPTGGNGLTDEELLASTIDPIELSSSESISQVNPIKQAESVTNKRNSEAWGTNLALTIKLAKNLTFKTAATYNTANTRADVFYQADSREAYRNGDSPYGQTQMTKDVRWSNNNNLSYKLKFNKKNNLDLMVGHEFSYRSSEYLLGQAKDFPFDQLGNDNLGLGATPSKVSTYKSEKKMLSFFARGVYNYDNRYLVTATIRADGSTVFSKQNKWGYFPSFSAAWRASEEAFMKDITWISNLKVRAGWGIVGNDRITNNLSLDLYEVSKYGVGSNLVTVLNPKQLPNRNLKWEGSTTTNLGIDLGFFQNRLNVTADFFIKNTKDLLLDQDLSYVSGFATQKQNIGKIQNKGIELSINSTNIQNRNFSWQTDFNIAFIKNTLKSLQPGTYVKYDRAKFSNDFKGYDYIASINSPLGQMYGYVFDGVYQYSDFYQVAGSDQLELKPGVTDIKEHAGVKAVTPGMVKYKDIDGDGVITTNDRTVIGNGIPKWYGGITNTFNYKGIDFSFMLQFNYGNDIYNATRLFATQSQDERSNQLAEVADRWTPTHASNKVPSARGYIKDELYSRFIEDGSFLRLKNVILGYTFPSKWTKKVYISRLRAYASAQNLFCISGYSGYDPEVSTAASNPMTPGLDWGAYPKSRVITFGLEVQF